MGLVACVWLVGVTLLFTTITILPCQGQSCSVGWFGSKCQYKCHCESDNCDANGQCTQNSKCQKGWFGPACQYADLSVTSNAPSWLVDNNDETCNPNSAIRTITATLPSPYTFTWLRLKASDAALLKNVTVDLRDTSNGRNISCNNQRSVVDSSTLDVHCSVPVLVKEVVFSGEGVVALCSLYISGGRNVALRQKTQQSTSLISTTIVTKYPSDKAVDGYTNGYFPEASCTHTADKDPSPNWNVTLDAPHVVTRYVLYNNKEDCCKDRLRGFALKSFDVNRTEVFTYTDKENSAQDVYTIKTINSQPVSTVEIRATWVDNQWGIILTLCEVELYGENTCPPGKYGLECDQTCNCALHSEACFASTGGCPSGCAAGYQGEGCTTHCPKYRFGDRCERNCSTNCGGDGSCHSVNGKCSSGCNPGYNGSLCNTGCPQTTFGMDCRETCSSNCKQQLCDHVIGDCLRCPTGLIGKRCDQICPKYNYGDGCKENCSTNCGEDGSCHTVNGMCSHGCKAGFKGSSCNTECSSTTFGKNCNETCSTNCTDQLCAPASGECLACLPGLTGKLCDQACSPKTYGIDCKETCSTNCMDQQCNAVTGYCFACTSGLTGKHCDQVCDQGRYGPACKVNCSQFCNVDEGTAPSICHHATGACILGCQEGYLGFKCDSLFVVHESDESTSRGIGIGVGCSLAVNVIILVVVVVFWCRRRRLATSARKDKRYHDVDLSTYKDHQHSTPDQDGDCYQLARQTPLEQSISLDVAPIDETTTDHCEYETIRLDTETNEDAEKSREKNPLASCEKGSVTVCGKENHAYVNDAFEK